MLVCVCVYIGPVFGYALVENAVFSILITHLTDEWNDSPNLPKAATIVNLQEGSSKVLQIFFTFVADAYSGLFLVLVISTAFYIIVSETQHISALHI